MSITIVMTADFFFTNKGSVLFLSVQTDKFPKYENRRLIIE